MRSENRKAREEEIEAAAYELFAEEGYAGTSMLSIAKRAKASNETLYRWYGDKVGLFRAMIASNANQARSLLDLGMERDRPALDILADFGPQLLGMLLGERAVALNRIAAANSKGDLGEILAKAGRNTVAPVLIALFEKAKSQGHFPALTASDCAETYLALLIGDLQIRRVTNAIPPLTEGEVLRRSRDAIRKLEVLARG